MQCDFCRLAIYTHARTHAYSYGVRSDVCFYVFCLHKTSRKLVNSSHRLYVFLSSFSFLLNDNFSAVQLLRNSFLIQTRHTHDFRRSSHVFRRIFLTLFANTPNAYAYLTVHVTLIGMFDFNFGSHFLLFDERIMSIYVLNVCTQCFLQKTA